MKYFITLIAILMLSYCSIQAQVSTENFWVKLENQNEMTGELIQEKLGLGVLDSFKMVKTEKDEIGYTHTRYQHTYKGIKVEGSEVILHKNAKGQCFLVNGRWVKNLNLESIFSGNMAALIESAKIYYSKDLKVAFDSIYIHNEPELVITKNYSKDEWEPQNFHYALRVVLSKLNHNELVAIYVDVNSKDVINAYPLTYHCTNGTANTTWHGTQTIITHWNVPNSYYHLYNNACGPTSSILQTMDYNSGSKNLLYTNTSTSWGTKYQYATTAHFYLNNAVNYLYNYQARNGFNGNGGTITQYINDNTYGSNNAYCTVTSSNTAYIGMGSGNMNTADIIGHEFIHSVTGTSAGLIYSKESGALNEAFSDIFATACERYLEQYMSGYSVDWTIGEDRGTPFRSLSSPKTYSQPNTKDGTYWYNVNGCTPSSSNDNCGVHTNSGLLNYVYYLMCQGGSGTNDNSYSYSVTGFGTNNATKIAYRALTSYLTSNSTYGDARMAFLQAATDLYGSTSSQRTETEKAFCAIGMGTSCSGSGGSCSYSLSASSKNAVASGENFNLKVNLSSTSCNFSIGHSNTSIAYVTYTNFSTGEITGYVTPNQTGYVRTAYIYIYGTGYSNSFIITQDAGSTTFTISTNSNPSNAGTTSGDGNYTNGTSVNLYANTNTGYVFDNWTLNGNIVSYSTSCTVTADANKTYTANFKQQQTQQYSISCGISPQNAGYITGGLGTFNSGATTSVSVSNYSGYMFVNFTENGNVVSTNNPYSFSVTSNRNIVANFTAITYTLNTNSIPSYGGSVSGGGTYNSNDYVTLNAYPSTGFVFDRWEDGTAKFYGNPTYSFSINNNKNVTAYFKAISSATNFSDKKEILIFPNPAKCNSELTIIGILNYESYKLINNMGSVVQEGALNKNRLMATNIAPGIYQLLLSNNENFIHCQILIE